MTRACIVPRCPYSAVSRGRCSLHRQTTGERGYDRPHQLARTRLASMLPTWCGYGCGTWLTPSDRWVAAHVRDGDPSAGYLVSCVRCNEQAKDRGVKSLPIGAAR